MPTDEQLMAAYCAGDPTALRKLFDRHAPALLRVMSHQIDDASVAEDLVQQTFLQLHRARHDYRPGSRLRPWLYTIALNLKRGYFRHRSRRREVPTVMNEARPADDTVEPTDLERARRVRAAVASLPETQREVVALHWLEGMSFAEVAEVVGASRSAVKVRAHRAYKILRKHLGDLAPPVTDDEPESYAGEQSA